VPVPKTLASVELATSEVMAVGTSDSMPAVYVSVPLGNGSLAFFSTANEKVAEPPRAGRIVPSR
jgi:hypothetical protein